MGRSKKTDSTLAVSLGAAIRRFRMAQGWTQDSLAERLGVEGNTISRIETGAHLPSLQRLNDLAAILGVSLGELLGSASSQPGDQARQLALLLERLSPPQRELILRVALEQAEFFRKK
jgi:transcriptional regulator with XRE-family HTH domain